MKTKGILIELLAVLIKTDKLGTDKMDWDSSYKNDWTKANI